MKSAAKSIPVPMPEMPLARFPFAPDRWLRPLPANGKHGNATLRLRPPEPIELAYLSWGKRQFVEPILAARHEGWHYFLVLRGSPALVVNGQRCATRPGFFSVADPECLVGHRDRAGQVCEILNWIWRTPPTHSALRPEKGAAIFLDLQRKQVRQIQALHDQCRRAVSAIEERNMLQLRATRMLIDLWLLEARMAQRDMRGESQFDRAVEFLRRHLGERRLVRSLCHHLGVSERFAHALFRRRTGQSPRAFVHVLRMESALQQLQGSNDPIKSIAIALGYRHPNDFSRAFKGHFGVSASEVAVDPRRCHD